MRIMHIYKSNKYRSLLFRISKKPRNDRKIKTVKFLFLLSIVEFGNPVDQNIHSCYYRFWPVDISRKANEI